MSVPLWKPSPCAPPILAIVVAAGEGRRMGRPKALLDAGGRTLLERHVERLAELGCERIAVVVRPDVAAALGDRVAPAGGASVVRVAAARTRTQGESLAEGARVLFGRTAIDTDALVVVTPVDLIPPCLATLRRLVDALAAPYLAVTPMCHGRGGHPVVVRTSVLAPFLAATPVDGPVPSLREVLAALGPRRLRVAVDDEAVLGDLDHPGDYERATSDAYSGWVVR
jgi:CTP:molybdopterin cytidylyltransferase MocA